MSPEQCTSSKVDQRSDIYSLAIVLFETLTGAVPFTAEELVKVMTMHLLDTPPTLSETRPDLRFPEQLEAVVARALSKHPEDRYQDMDEFSYALDESLKVPQKTLVAMPSLSSIPAVQNPQKEAVSMLAAQLNTTRSTQPAAQENYKILGGPPQVLKDLAHNTLSEVMTRTSKDRPSGRKTEITAHSIPAQTPNPRLRQTARKPQLNIWQLIARQIFPVAFTACALLAVITFVMNEVRMIRLTPQRHTTEYAEKLVKQGRYEEALPVLQDLKQSGSLDKAQIESLNKVRVSVAKIYAHKKRFSDAISLLQQVPQTSKHKDQAKSLIRRYKGGKN